MALIIEAPNEIYSSDNNNNIKIFLAGGITNCPDWQNYVISELKEVPEITIYNPRRKNFSINDPKNIEEQIVWEFNHLRDTDIILYWFSRGSLNPIVLYELGMWGNSRDTIIIVGVDPQYERKQDVVIQTQLAKPGITIFDSLDLMLEQLDYIVKALKGEIEID